MRKLLLSALLAAAGFCGKAQYPGYALLTDLSTFKTRFSEQAQKVTTIRSEFVQEKNLSMLSEKIVSKGKFWFKKDSRVRMEYNQPFQYLLIINKDKVLVKDGQKQNTISTRSNKLFQQINKIMVDCVQGTILSNPDFNTRVFENKKACLVELSPVSKNLKEFFKTIVVTAGKDDYSVSDIEMNENSGDNTIIHFVNKELNATLPDSLFAID